VVAGTGIAVGLLLGVGVTVLLRPQFYEVAAVEWTVLDPVSAAMRRSRGCSLTFLPGLGSATIPWKQCVMPEQSSPVCCRIAGIIRLEL
jgi:hypothetical protein